MTPKTILDLFIEWKADRARLKDNEAFIVEKIMTLMRKPEFDFSYFKLKKDTHTKYPCAIYGMCHDWIATYPDTEWETHKILSINVDLAGAIESNVVSVRITYDNGDCNYADIPQSALDGDELFKIWYDEQLENYKKTKADLCTYIKEREETYKTDEFKKWLAAGDKFIQLGLVRVTSHGEEVLEKSRG